VIKKNRLAVLVLPAAFMLSSAQALTLGDYEIDTVADFDVSTAASISDFGVTGASGFVAAVEDDLLTSFVTANVASSFGLSFTGNSLVNGVGNDLILFSLGTPQSIDLTIGTSTRTFTSIATGLTASGFGVNAFLVNLDALDVASDAAVNSVLLSMGAGFDFALGGALAPSPIPVPAAVWMFGSGLIGLVGIARRRRS
jgi:hypothetical protein